MKRLVVIVIMCGSCLFWTVPVTHAATCSGLMVRGASLVDSCGNSVVLRGFSQGPTPLNMLDGWQRGLRPHTDKLSLATFTAMRAWHANSVRIPLSAYECLKDGSHCALSGPYMSEARLDIGNARTAGLYVVLALFDDVKAGSPYTQGGLLRPEDIAFLRLLATVYHGDTGILYDPVNEPHYTSNSQWANGCHSCTPEIDGYNDAIHAIRATGANAPIVIAHDNEQGTMCRTANGISVDRQEFLPDEVGVLHDTALLYTLHAYHTVAIGDSVAWSCMLHGLSAVPVYVGEWAILPHGTARQCQSVTSSNADNKVTAFLRWLATGNSGHAVSWSAWNFETHNAIQDNYSSYTPTVMRTGSWTCADGSSAAANAGQGSDIRAYLTGL